MLGVAACGAGPPSPAALDTSTETCRFCRMTIADARFAAQLVAPYEEPLFFDDVGCLASFLKTSKSVSPDAVAYVADHRTKAWIPATDAVFATAAAFDTPMGSRIVAHADRQSREADLSARGATAVDPTEIFGESLPRRGGR